MKGSMRILLVLASAAVIVALASPVLAGPCAIAREASMRQNGMDLGRGAIDPDCPTGPAWNFDGNEKGVWWELGNPANGSGAPDYYPGGADSCPITTGGSGGVPWLAGGGAGSQPPRAKTISFFVSSTPCDTEPVTGACPEGAPLSILVEDTNDNGSDAAFINYVVDPQLTSIRWWDLAAADPNTQPSNDVTHCLEPYPAVDVTSSSGGQGNTTLNNLYANIDINFWGNYGGGQTAPTISNYKVYAVNAASEPGRARANWGAPVRVIPYPGPGAPVSDSFLVPCDDPAFDTYVAVGIEFDGAIDGFYVGKSTVVECNPNIAEPEPTKIRRQDRLQRRPTGRRGR